jgi:hypothetical protein
MDSRLAPRIILPRDGNALLGLYPQARGVVASGSAIKIRCASLLFQLFVGRRWHTLVQLSLPRQVVVECFQRRASGRSLRHRLAKGRIGLPWTLKGAPADGVGQGTMIGMGGCLALPKRVALYQESFRGALEVSLLEHLVIEGIRTTACDVEEDGDRNRVLQSLGCNPPRSTARASSTVSLLGLRVRISRKVRVDCSFVGSSACQKSSRAVSTTGFPSTCAAIAP